MTLVAPRISRFQETHALTHVLEQFDPGIPDRVQNIDALLGGTRWSSGNLSYSFPGFDASFSGSPSTGYGPSSGDGDPWSSFYGPLSAPGAGDDQTYFSAALQAWANVANLHFTLVADTATNVGDIRAAYSYTAEKANAQAWAYYPSNSAIAGDVWFNAKGTSATRAWTPGSYNYITILHELGHALGLKHAFEASGSQTAVVPLSLDSRSYTVMSYSAQPGNDRTHFSFEPTTPMRLDIAAIQYLYGVNTAYHAGDDAYTFTDSTTYHQTIWDGGGNDSLQYSGSFAASIDLRAGHGSSIGRPVNIVSSSGAILAKVSNVWIADGVLIENASGGSGNDSLIGNDADNRLSGGPGADMLTGGGGNDIFAYIARGDSTVSATDTITDFTAGDKLGFAGMAGIALYSGATLYAGSVSSTLNAIQNNGDLSNRAVFFTDGTDGYLYIKGAGTGLSFDGTFINLAGRTAALTLADFIGVSGNQLPSGSIAIGGALIQGQLLSAINTLADADGLGAIHYQWSVAGFAISGATSSTFLLTEAQVGKSITLSASYVDGSGTAESVSSPASGPVAAAPGRTVTGTSANDVLVSAAGNENIDGGAGFDSLRFAGNRSDYTTSRAGSGVMVIDSVTGRDGVDTVTNIERLVFADAKVALDIDGNAGQAYRLYQAAFDRKPDIGGLTHWIATRDAGAALDEIARSFVASQEFVAGNGANLDNNAFVNLMYANVLHRAPDPGGFASWVNALNSGQTQAQVLAQFSESAENKLAMLPVIQNGITYDGSAGIRLVGKTGDENLVGGVGLDTVRESGARAQYTVTATSTGFIVADKVAGRDGTDTLRHVERLEFSDSALAFDIGHDDAAGQVYRLYQAAFDRTPDVGGVSFWIRAMDGGLSLNKVAAAFVASAEFTSRNGSDPGSTEFVTAMYSNVLHRAPDSGGLAFWVNQLDSHAMSTAQVLTGFSESEENYVAVIGVIQNGVMMDLG